ncbi:MAG: hypothetical protein ACR5K2_03385 [Wolbachia sp.]
MAHMIMIITNAIVHHCTLLSSATTRNSKIADKMEKMLIQKPTIMAKMI